MGLEGVSHSLPQAVASILQRPAASWTHDEIAHLRTAVEQANAGPKQLSGMDPFSKTLDLLESYPVLYGDKAERYAAAWRHADASLEQNTEVVHSIFARDPSTWSVTDGATLQALLFDVAEDARPKGPVQLTGMNGLDKVAADVVKYTSMYLQEARRYAEAWRSLADPGTLEQNTATVRGIFARDPKTWSPQDGVRLQNLLFDVPEHVRPVGPRQLIAAKDLNSIAVDVVKYPSLYMQDARRYAEAWRTLDAPGTLEQNTEVVQSIFGRDPKTWSPEDAARLQNLLFDAPEHVRPAGPRQLTGTQDLNSIAVDVVKYPNLYMQDARRYAEAWRTLDAPGTLEQNTSTVNEIFARDPETWSPEDAARLQNLLFDAPEHVRPAGPRNLTGAKDLNSIAVDVVKYPSLYMQDARRYAGAWRTMADPGTLEQNTETVKEIFARDPSTWTPDDAARLQNVLFDAPEHVRPAGPRKLPGAKDLNSLSTDVVKYPTLYMDDARLYAVAWRAQHDPNYMSNLKTQFESFLAGNGDFDESIRTYIALVPSAIDDALSSTSKVFADRVISLIRRSDERALREILAARELLPQSVSAEWQALHDETEQLIQRNIGRITGRHEEGAVRGYSNYPNYSEIGTIKANVAMLNDVVNTEALTGATPPKEKVTW